MINVYPSSENPSREGCDCAVATSTALIIAGMAASAATTAYQVHSQNAAADRAAGLETQAAQQQREALERESGVNQGQFDLTFNENRREWESTQRRNYQMWRTREMQLAPYRGASLAAQNEINRQTGLQPVAMAAPPDYDSFSRAAGVYDTRGDSASGSARYGPALPRNTSDNPVALPRGIDPRLGALYQRYGVQPGERGSGLTDWQYWQNDALHNASGDWGYVTDRLESDLRGDGPDAGGGSAPAPRTLASIASSSGGGRLGPGNTSLAAMMQPGSGATGPTRARVAPVAATQINPYSLYALFANQPRATPQYVGDVPPGRSMYA